MKRQKPNKPLLSEDDILTYGKLRGMGYSKEETVNRMVLARNLKKLVNLNRKGK